MMKAINVFLLLLILIGLGAFATQSIWVPKLVDRIVASETVPPALVEASQPNLTLQDGRQCYTYSHEATPEAPYQVSELIDITITNGVVNGNKAGTQSGPDMTNGYAGTLVGTSDKNSIDAIFSYVVEGSKNKERELYKTNKTGLEKLRYQLIEKDGMLVPDMTKEFTALPYSMIDCKGSN